MGDQIEKYGDNVSEIGGSQPKRIALKLKPNGDCIFLGDKGCSIYEDRPYVCRDFDCRRAVANFPKTALNEVVRAGIFSQDIVDAAKERMGSLKQEPWEKLTLEQKRQYLLRLSRPPR
jgi:Fe-S-cluster containining protein